jgi:hypothetical protein
VQQGRADVALQVDVERTGHAADHAGHHEDQQLDAEGRQTQGLGTHLVVAQRLHAWPSATPRSAPAHSTSASTASATK